MAEFDWAIASIIFVSAIAALFVALPVLIPKVNPYTQGQYDAAFRAISQKAQKQDLFLKADCNSQQYDCSGYYSLRADSADANFFFSNPVMQHGSEAISYAKLNQPYSAYLNTGGVTNTSLPATGMYYSVSSGVFHAGIPSGIDLNQSPSVLSALFAGSNPQYDIRATYSQPNSFSLAQSNSFLASASDSSTSAAVRVFGTIPEFWIDLPADQNLNISTSQNAWKQGTYSGLVSGSAAWWDSDPLDSVAWSYRIPFTVFSNGVGRTDEIAEIDFNFLSVFSILNASGQLEPNSVRLVEYSGNGCINHTHATAECDSMPLEFDYSPTTGIGKLDFRLLGFTDANSSRQFELYFDSTSNPNRETASVSDETITYSAPAVPVLSTILSPQSSPSPKVLVANSLVLFDPNTITLGFDPVSKSNLRPGEMPYRIPFVFSSGNNARTDTALSSDINFELAFRQAGCTSCALDSGSVSFLEVNSLSESRELSRPAYSFDYNSETRLWRLSWTASGTLAAQSKKYYLLYFRSA